MTRPLAYDDARHQAAHQFLVEEAYLLDSSRFDEWLGLLHPEIRYRMPVTVTTARANVEPVLGAMDHFDEDLRSLTKRVERLATDTAWTEDPPSRVRHLVTNVRTFAADGEDELLVESYVLLFRSRLDTRPPDLVSAGRRDVLRATGAVSGSSAGVGSSGGGDGPSGWLLARRDIDVDEAVLRTQNLAIFL